MTFATPTCSDFVCLMNYNNSISNYMFGYMTLVTIFVISFVITLAYGDPKKSFVGSSWLTFMLSLPLAVLGVVNTAAPIILIVVGCISLIPLFIKER